MFAMRTIDGTPVDHDYLKKVSALVSGAATAIEMFSEDELEEHAAKKIPEADWLQRCHKLENKIAEKRLAAKGPLCLAEKLAIMEERKALEAQLRSLRLRYFQLVG